MKAIIVPLTTIEYDVLEASEKGISRCFGIEALALTETAGVPLTAYNFERGQYDSVKVIAWLSEEYKVEGVDFIVGIGDIDAYVEGLNFVFGTANSQLNTCVVYTRRLRQDRNLNVYVARVVKEVIHEMGHLLGLEHCSNPRCVMRFSNNVAEVDVKSDRLCRGCASRLEARGIGVSSECIM